MMPIKNEAEVCDFFVFRERKGNMSFKFMDKKAEQMCEEYCKKVVERNFDENDVYGFYIFIRNYLDKIQGKYPWIAEWADLIAHRPRNQGKVFWNIKNAEKNNYTVLEGTRIIKGYKGMAEGVLEKEFYRLFKKLGYEISKQIQKELVLCTFSIVNFSQYKIGGSSKKIGQVRLWQTKTGLALLTYAGGKDDTYIFLSNLTGDYIHTDFSAGRIEKPVKALRKQGELLFLCDGEVL